MIHNSPRCLASRALAVLATSLMATAAAMGNPFFAFDNGQWTFRPRALPTQGVALG